VPEENQRMPMNATGAGLDINGENVMGGSVLLVEVPKKLEEIKQELVRMEALLGQIENALLYRPANHATLPRKRILIANLTRKDISGRLRYRFERNDIAYLDQLEDLPPRTIKCWKCMGKATFHELCRLMMRHGIRFSNMSAEEALNDKY